MTQQQQDRIKADAEAYAGQFKHGFDYRKPAYIDGATAEAERAQVLVDALEEITTWKQENRSAACILTHIKNFAYEKLKQWNEGKEVTDPCPHCGKELSRDRNLCCRECGKEVSGEDT